MPLTGHVNAAFEAIGNGARTPRNVTAESPMTPVANSPGYIDGHIAYHRVSAAA